MALLDLLEEERLLLPEAVAEEEDVLDVVAVERGRSGPLQAVSGHVATGKHAHILARRANRHRDGPADGDLAGSKWLHKRAVAALAVVEASRLLPLFGRG